MALISAKTILTSISLFHITLAFFFFTNPNSIADQALVYMLGESMGMPRTTAFDAPSPTSSFLATVLLVLGLSDLLTLSMPDEIWLVHYWGSQSPLRVTLFGILTIYTFLTSGSTRQGGARMSHPVAPPGFLLATGQGGWDGLRNRVFFTFAFLELLSWFWVWTTLREEAGRFAMKKRRRSSSSGERY